MTTASRRGGGTAPGPANPVLVEVTRGHMAESRHRGAVAVVDAAGGVKLAVGEVERPVYARSGIKPIQALVVLETGAGEAFALGEEEIALACASHGGEKGHTDLVSAWLDRIGCTVDDLECGPQTPLDEAAARALHGAGEAPSALHNNCSGQHAGFLSVARHLGLPTKGYIGRDHPVQQRALRILEEMGETDLSAVPQGIDGCGIPVVGLPLSRIALAMARLANPESQPEPRRAAAARIRRAMAAEPFLVAGTNRFCTRVMEVTGARALVKEGAEGVCCGALPELGLGIALKVDDGASRAASVVMGRLLRHFRVLGADEADLLADVLEPAVCNPAGLEVGRVRPAADCPF
ncbi:MAG: asparaginase [Alphaproteobacteria bacterium]